MHVSMKACTGECTIWRTINGTKHGPNSTSCKAPDAPPKPPLPPAVRLW